MGHDSEGIATYFLGDPQAPSPQFVSEKENTQRWLLETLQYGPTWMVWVLGQKPEVKFGHSSRSMGAQNTKCISKGGAAVELQLEMLRLVYKVWMGWYYMFL